MAELTQSELQSLLEYNPATGVLVWQGDWGWKKRGRVAGSVMDNGYRHIAVNGRIYAAHRLAWFYVYGEWPKKQLDHINGNRDDNRMANLREATNAQNCMNRVPTGASGLKGVYWIAEYGKWAARFNSRKMRVRLGFHDTKEAAARAYDQKAKEVYGEFARLNFPETA